MKDFFKKDLHIGDEVVFMELNGYSGIPELHLGKISTFLLTSEEITYAHIVSMEVGTCCRRCSDIIKNENITH